MIDIAEEELIKNKGAVVNVSSVAAIIPSSTWGIYGVVKAAQDKLTTNLAFMVRTPPRISLSNWPAFEMRCRAARCPMRADLLRAAGYQARTHAHVHVNLSAAFVHMLAPEPCSAMERVRRSMRPRACA